MITDIGLQDIIQFIYDNYDYVSVGTGTTEPSNSDTALKAEVLDRAEATKIISTTFYTNDTIELRGTFTPAYNVEISEIGIQATLGGTSDLLCRETTVPKTCMAGIPFDAAYKIVAMR